MYVYVREASHKKRNFYLRMWEKQKKKKIKEIYMRFVCVISLLLLLVNGQYQYEGTFN